MKKIHSTLPHGGILVFLTGKKEINYLCQRLNLELNKSQEDLAMSDDDEENPKLKKAKNSMEALILPLYS